jgi:hypothetical protein
MILVTKVAGSWVVEIVGEDLGIAMHKAVSEGTNVSRIILDAVRAAFAPDIPEDVDN